MKIFARFILFMAAISFAANGYAQLTANFTADVTAGCSPVVVHFTNTTTPMGGTTFSWNLGLGGALVTSTNASSSYITPGTYTITLTATNGGSTSTHSMTVTVYPLPTVSFTANDTNVCPGTPVTFTSTSTGGVPGPLSCTWSFGDGSTGSGNPISHSYVSPGYYNVKLAATNNDGCQNTLTIADYIDVYTPPVAHFSGTQYYCKAPATDVFSSTSTGTAPLSYAWSFGDGGTSTSSGPSHTYTSPGSYTVSLVVTDGHGCKDTLTVPNYVTIDVGHASISGPSTACVGSSVTFNDLSTAHTSETWTFGDGGSERGDPGNHAYAASGTYSVTLVTWDGHCADTATQSIIILPAPVATFTQTPIHPCPPFSLTFTASAPPGSIITWVYGDHTTNGSGTVTSHTYNNPGIDTILMIVRDPATGCVDTFMRIDTLYDLEIQLSATPINGCAPLNVSFSATPITFQPDPSMGPYTYPFPVASYTWHFGDGSTGSGSNPSHVYTAAGTYESKVTIITSNGCSVTDSFPIQVGAPPIVTFTVTPSHVCYNSYVTFITTIIRGPVDEWDWFFSDNSSFNVYGGSGNTTHMFALPGTFSATLTPSYHGCPGPPVVFSGIVVDSPKAIIKDSVLCYPVNAVLFTDQSLGDDSHIWIFGDGTTSTVADPTHIYAAANVYTVALATYNVRSGCRDTDYTAIDLRRPVPNFSTPDTAVCRDTFLLFTGTYTGGGLVLDYHWIIPGAYTHLTDSVQVTDTFHVTGTYPVTLVAKDQNGCYDTVTKAHYILVAKPVASFTLSPPTGCVPLTVTFSDHSTDVTGTFFTNFAWTFGDGTSASVSTPVVMHTYTAPGSFTDVEIVTDNIGCKDTATLSLVTAWQPVASFTVNNQNPCPNATVTFTNTSTGSVSYYWLFGDGTTSTLTAPSHVYTATGSYTVKLVATDLHGCTDTASYIGYINVAVPLAAFHMNDSLSICPPANVTFINTSVGGSTYAWNLGDGSSSALFSPTDLYLTPGYYTVTLVVTNAFGCVDSTHGHVTVFGYAGAFNYGPSDTGCAPLTVHFSANTSNVPNIIWDFADGSVSHVSHTDSISHTYTQPGAYVPKLILNDNSGCENSSIGSDTIKVDAITGGFGPIPNPVCLGDTFILVDSSSSFWSIINSQTWHMHGITTTVDTPRFYIDTVGTYPATLMVTDGWGCVANLSNSVSIVPLPVITVSKDTTVCVGDAAVLRSYGGITYAWQPASTLSCATCNPTDATPAVVTTYTVTGTDANRCSNTDTTTVHLRTLTNAKAWGDTTICFGQYVPLYDSGGTKYTWLPTGGLNGNTNQADVSASPPSTYRYMAIAQLADCIPDTNYVTVTVEQLPTVNAGPNQTIAAGSTAQLKATGSNIATIEWSNSATLSCSTCMTPVASMSVTTTYVITVASDLGCLASDSVTINLYCNSGEMFLPNSFTPNNDGENDVFYPRGEGVSKVKTFRIYNRWGELIFERSDFSLNDRTMGWDGTYQGSTPRPDVYVWLLEATCESGQQLFLKGDVTIIR